MQSENGGYGSFDADNTYYYLNEIPFADHGALLDPPTSDVTATDPYFDAIRQHHFPGPACIEVNTAHIQSCRNQLVTNFEIACGDLG